MTAAPVTLHATCVLVGEAGILIRGPSGSGKSALARDILFEADGRGRFARLVCDDRVRLTARNGRLVATAVPAIAGKLEARGVGIVPVPYEPSAVIRLVVDCLGEDAPRLPVAGDRKVRIGDIGLPRIGVRFEPGIARLILLRLSDLHDTFLTE
jgi:hypothetical protein